MRLMAFAVLLFTIQLWTATVASAGNGFFSDYHYGQVANFLAATQGRQSLPGRVFEIDQRGPTIVYGDCADLYVQLNATSESIGLRASSIKANFTMHEIFHHTSQGRGEAHLRHINKNHLEISINYPTKHWLDSERTTLNIQKDDENRVTRFEYRSIFRSGSFIPWMGRTIWKKGFVCRKR